MPDLPGRELARELIGKSRAESRATPIEAVIAAAGQNGVDAAAAGRLIGRLWTLERMFYYIYGGWGQGLEMNDFPASVKYLFSKQIVDEFDARDAVSRCPVAARDRCHPKGGV